MKGAIRLGVLTIVLFFGGLGGWALLAPLDGAVIGNGALAVGGNRKTVQHRDGGIVAALLVQDGDRVAAGQVLLRLDDTQALAICHVHEASLFGDVALTARDTAEIAEAPTIAFPDNLPQGDPVARSVMDRERTVFASHRDLMSRQLAVIDQRITEARQQQAGAAIELQATRQALALGEQELAGIAALARIGLAARDHWLELGRSIDGLRGQEGELTAEVARHGAEAAEFAAEKLRLREAALGDATRELREAQLRINDVLPRLAADRDLLARLEIRAPVAGRVVDLQIFTRGGVIEPGKPILDLVPDAPRIVAEAEIRPEDIEYLRVGQAARVIATGFNPRETPPLEGRVTVISADRITDPRTGRTYFKAEITLLSDRAHAALLARLGPGMPVEVIVPTRARTAFDYLVEPLRGSLRGAMREM